MISWFSFLYNCIGIQWFLSFENHALHIGTEKEVPISLAGLTFAHQLSPGGHSIGK